jgi:hypothetical protein
LGASLIVQFVVLFVSSPGAFTIMSPPWEATFQVGLGAAALATTAIYMVPRAMTLAIVVLIAGFLMAGVTVIHTSPSPPIDVFVFQEQSSYALLHGRNPYTESFPDIYGGTPGPWTGTQRRRPVDVRFPRAAESAARCRVTRSLATIGTRSCGDGDRGGADDRRQPDADQLARGGAVPLTPRSFFVLEQGWTEPFCVLLVSATAFVFSHRPRAWPYLLGLAIVDEA